MPFGLSKKIKESVGGGALGSVLEFMVNPGSSIGGAIGGRTGARIRRFSTGRDIEGAGRSIRDMFRPDMPKIPTPPVPGAPIQQARRPAMTFADELFGQAAGIRPVRTRGPGTETLLGRRRARRRPG